MFRWFELSGEERRRVVETLRRELEGDAGIAFAFVFGSFVEGGPFRDVDVGIYLRRSLDVLEAYAYAEELSARLSRAVALPVDVVVLNFAPTWLRRRALRGLELFVKDELLWAAVWASAVDEEEGLRLHTQ
ncbi:nucleotidyltransferase domain-containing protein [Pyrobaculum sp. 3827-6]|uniref:nucleotidyltransferase domain-containing protein n=1 Tax=Pyrobaculum sp. 3827-6 TaxID=2983604 RepID=UPI0021DA9BB9|nr:nucleotidyltransferase domain-containing protein [Pyrobaculum sp. 3827-6]MCU7787738.1 nucleotidyltransferase domain-containing protein [Pyrobaculum sp. 3827-6]